MKQVMLVPVIFLAAFLCFATSAAAQKNTNLCGVYPALAVQTPANTCLAVIATSKDGLKFPRKISAACGARLAGARHAAPGRARGAEL
jgi:hypothetical protein